MAVDGITVEPKHRMTRVSRLCHLRCHLPLLVATAFAHVPVGNADANYNAARNPCDFSYIRPLSSEIREQGRLQLAHRVLRGRDELTLVPIQRRLTLMGLVILILQKKGTSVALYLE